MKLWVNNNFKINDNIFGIVIYLFYLCRVKLILKLTTMSKKSFQERYNDLKSGVILSIKLSVLKSKRKSQFSDTTIITINDEQLQFNIHRSYIVEVSHNDIIDSDGYTYGIQVLDLEQLCQLADYCSKQK